ncbi:MAG: hypothetical protein ACR65R_04440 [Methylomicrobium sp.]
MSFDRLSQQARTGALALLSMLLFAAPASSAPSKTSGGSGAIAISPINQPDPTRGSQLNDVAVNASGLTVAAWDQCIYTTGGPYTIGMAVQSGGKWGAPFTISGTTGFSMNPRVAVGADGTMAVSWMYQDATLTQQQVQVAVKRPADTTWTTTTLAQGPVGGVAVTGFVPIGIDANGNVTAAWTLWDGTRHVVQSATFLPKGGVWSAPITLSGPAEDGLYLSLAVNARGDAAVAYTISPYAAYTTGSYAEYVFRSGPNGSWTSPVVVSEVMPSSNGYITNPLVALDANGLATMAYMGYGVEAARQKADGTWTLPQTVLQAPNQVSSYLSPDLAVDAAGNAVVVVSIFDATIGVDRASVWVARGTPDGSWTSQQRLTDPSVPIDAYAAQVGMSPDGTLALVGWIDHYHGTVQVSKLTNGAWSVANTIGRGTAWSSFQEVLSLDVASGTVGRAIWKNAKTGTQIYATNVN